MVGFTGSWNKRFHSGSLSDTIQQNCQVVQEAVAVQIELDLAKELSRIPCSAAVAETFVEILGRVVQRSQPNGTIEVTACVFASTRLSQAIPANASP